MATALAGCGPNESTSPSPPSRATTTSAPDPAKAFDPCTIPHEFLIAEKLNGQLPLDRSDNTDGPIWWKGCAGLVREPPRDPYDRFPPAHGFSLQVTNSNIDKLPRHFTNVTRPTINGRRAVRYQTPYLAKGDIGCGVLVEMKGGALLVTLDSPPVGPGKPTSCEQTQALATKVAALLPPNS